MLKLLYFDHDERLWTIRRPAKAGSPKPDTSNYTVAVASLSVLMRHHQTVLPSTALMALQSANCIVADGTTSPVAPYAGDSREDRMPHLLSLLDVNPVNLRAVMDTDWIRRNYAMCELEMGGESAGTVILWRLSVPVQVAEYLGHTLPPESRRPIVAVHSRLFAGGQFTLVAAHINPSTVGSSRVRSMRQMLSKTLSVGQSGSSSTTVLCSNAYELSQPDQLRSHELLDLHRSLDAERVASEMDELLPSGSKSESRGPCAVWVGGLRQGPLRSELAIVDAKGEPRLKMGVVTLMSFLGGLPPDNSPGALSKGAVVEPMFPSSPSLPTTGATEPPDLAGLLSSGTVPPLSHRHSPQSHISPSTLNTIKRRSWSVKQSCSIRIREGTDEEYYDVSLEFGKADDCLRALNLGTCLWDADFIVCQGRLFSAQGQSPDVSTFKAYIQQHAKLPKLIWPDSAKASSKKGGPLDPAILSAMPLNSNTRNSPEQPGSFNNRGQPPPFGQQSQSAWLDFGPLSMATMQSSMPRGNRRRNWSKNHTECLFQVTPKEMRFDITPIVGVGPGGLDLAIDRLNGIASACRVLNRRPPPASILSLRNAKKADAAASKSGLSTGAQEFTPNSNPAASRDAIVESTPTSAGTAASSTSGDRYKAQATFVDPLANYPHDYALLYCPERQGYWLIAATDMPCDSSMCRYAANNVTQPVAVRLGGFSP